MLFKGQFILPTMFVAILKLMHFLLSVDVFLVIISQEKSLQHEALSLRLKTVTLTATFMANSLSSVKPAIFYKSSSGLFIAEKVPRGNCT